MGSAPGRDLAAGEMLSFVALGTPPHGTSCCSWDLCMVPEQASYRVWGPEAEVQGIMRGWKILHERAAESCMPEPTGQGHAGPCCTAPIRAPQNGHPAPWRAKHSQTPKHASGVPTGSLASSTLQQQPVTALPLPLRHWELSHTPKAICSCKLRPACAQVPAEPINPLPAPAWASLCWAWDLLCQAL